MKNSAIYLVWHFHPSAALVKVAEGSAQWAVSLRFCEI